MVRKRPGHHQITTKQQSKYHDRFAGLAAVWAAHQNQAGNRENANGRATYQKIKQMIPFRIVRSSAAYCIMNSRQSRRL
jgi:hypothetical protein